MIDYAKVPAPAYVVDEERLRNLSLIRSVKERAGVEIILAFKAFALWKLFPIVREYIPCSTASSLSEARLAVEEMKNLAHTYSPAYTEEEFDEIAQCSSHITFNSLSQFSRYYERKIAYFALNGFLFSKLKEWSLLKRALLLEPTYTMCKILKIATKKMKDIRLL